MTVFLLTACAGEPADELSHADFEAVSSDEDTALPGGEDRDAESIAAVWRDIYDGAAEAGTLGSTEIMGRIVARLGERGYAAVDAGNQVDMAGAEQVLRFVEAVEERESRTLTIVVIMGTGFRKFDLETRDGAVTVVRSYFQYDGNGSPQERSTVSYRADYWEYTPEGYLIFSGSCLLPEAFVMTLDVRVEHTALRVLPLEERCRELNRKYIMPTGYERNNMFLCNWDEEDYGELDFYDVFDRFYPAVYGEPVPYAAAEDLEEEPVYMIPGDIFEQVITAYCSVDAAALLYEDEIQSGAGGIRVQAARFL
ncbi:MAG: hypothetical protein HFH93_11545 [Lachnospiraceae bacterium]|nr:hypothetical protein [Lachnospiraceae bacterium]